MHSEQQITYMANLAHAVFADGNAIKLEDQLFNSIARRIGAKRPHMEKAVTQAQKPGFKLEFPFGFADSVHNLEDMLVLILANKKLAATEKQVIVEAKQQLGLSEAQFRQVVEDAKARLKQASARL